MYHSIVMLLDELHTKKQQIEQLAQKYGAKRIRVFGSVARGEETEQSDIDFLVDFPLIYDMFEQRIPLMLELETMFNRKIDLIPEKELNRHIAEQVKNEAVPI